MVDRTRLIVVGVPGVGKSAAADRHARAASPVVPDATSPAAPDAKAVARDGRA